MKTTVFYVTEWTFLAHLKTVALFCKKEIVSKCAKKLLNIPYLQDKTNTVQLPESVKF